VNVLSKSGFGLDSGLQLNTHFLPIKFGSDQEIHVCTFWEVFIAWLTAAVEYRDETTQVSQNYQMDNGQD
jgi:hypothetical protein